MTDRVHMAVLFFKHIYKNKRTYCACVSFWAKKFKKLQDLYELKNDWKRKFSGWDGVFPMYEFHNEEKIIVINQYDPADAPEDFDEREYITAYIQTDESNTERLYIWLLPTENNVVKAMHLSELWLRNPDRMDAVLEEIYSHHKQYQ